MVNSCVAYNCTERYRKGGVAFHRFPTSQDLRDKWIKALRRSNFTPNQYSKLCAKHFSPDCYDSAPWSYLKRLKEGAVPTIFEFSQKTKHRKKSLDNSTVVTRDREFCAVSQNVIKVPVSPSTSRRKQLIIERKEFNASEANLRETQSLECLLKKTKPSEETVETESCTSLPSKRCRKKKELPSEFVCEDWTSRRRCKTNKSKKEDKEAKQLGVRGKSGVFKSSEKSKGETEKESAAEDEPSVVLSDAENCDSSNELSKGHKISLVNGKKSTNKELREEEKIVFNHAIDGSDENKLKKATSTISDKSNFKVNKAGCDQVPVRNRENNVLVGNTPCNGFFIQTNLVSESNGLEMNIVNVEDISQSSKIFSNSNEKESDSVSELLVATTALHDISCSQEYVASVGDAKIAKKIENCGAGYKNVQASSSTSNQVSPAFKLNLEEEESMLQRCMQLGEAAKRKKLVRLKKLLNGNDIGSVSGNQNRKTLSSEENEVFKSCRRKAYLGDFKQDDLLHPEKAAKCLKVAQKVIREKTLKIKHLRQRERRLIQKVEELENVIFHLVEKRMNPEEASTVLIVLKENA